jgi:hypothetical protein
VFFYGPSVTAFWNSLGKILHELQALTHCRRNGYSTLGTTPQQLANYLLVLAKTTVYKTYLAKKSTHRHIPDWQRMFCVTFRGCWLHRNILRKDNDGRIMLCRQI